MPVVPPWLVLLASAAVTAAAWLMAALRRRAWLRSLRGLGEVVVVPPEVVAAVRADPPVLGAASLRVRDAVEAGGVTVCCVDYTVGGVRVRRHRTRAVRVRDDGVTYGDPALPLVEQYGTLLRG